VSMETKTELNGSVPFLLMEIFYCAI